MVLVFLSYMVVNSISITDYFSLLDATEGFNVTVMPVAFYLKSYFFLKGEINEWVLNDIIALS